MAKIRVYQINSRDSDRTMFLNYEQVQARGGIKAENYDLVFDGEVEAKTLEDIYCVFNSERYSDIVMRSLSVSDVVEIVESNTVKKGFYFCDTVGWKKLEEKERMDADSE